MLPEPTRRLDRSILVVLRNGPMHGQRIATALRLRGVPIDGSIGLLYPALRRLERKGFVTAFWRPTHGRPRRTYQLTGPGRWVADRIES